MYIYFISNYITRIIVLKKFRNCTESLEHSNFTQYIKTTLPKISITKTMYLYKIVQIKDERLQLYWSSTKNRARVNKHNCKYLWRNNSVIWENQEISHACQRVHLRGWQKWINEIKMLNHKLKCYREKYTSKYLSLIHI